MIVEKQELLRATIVKSVGANVTVEVNADGRRAGLDVWFAPWRKRDGPVFRIKPAGLRRHVVSMEFGRSSGLCLRRIAQREPDQTELAQALLRSIKPKAEFKVDALCGEIGPSVAWHAKIKGIDSQHADETLIATTKDVMVPMIAAMAELIGFEEVEHEAPEFEGSVSKKLVTIRERSRRNRLLALQIHGYECKVCGLKPLESFGEAIGGILEVHHIEPVSALGEARPYDPERDLIPLCPNCHRMIHQKDPPYMPDELKEILTKRNG